jgi:hypothetical protein
MMSQGKVAVWFQPPGSTTENSASLYSLGSARQWTDLAQKLVATLWLRNGYVGGAPWSRRVSLPAGGRYVWEGGRGGGRRAGGEEGVRGPPAAAAGEKRWRGER